MIYLINQQNEEQEVGQQENDPETKWGKFWQEAVQAGIIILSIILALD